MCQGKYDQTQVKLARPLRAILFNFYRKAPEFQCHIKYRNELPLPPVSPMLLDASLTLPLDNLSRALHEASNYTPTSLEHGTKHFHLPADLLKSSLFDWVDLERFKVGRGGNGLPEDKELMTQVDGELPKESVNVSSAGAVNAAPVKKKFARPEVTWLRRTEYISSVKNANAATGPAVSVDEAKAALAQPVEWQEIVTAVEDSFEAVKEARHPLKPELTLQQSFPIGFDEARSLAHLLFLGEAGSSITEHSLLLAKDSQEIVSLFSPKESGEYVSPPDGLQFEIQRAAQEAGKRSMVLLLPVGEEGGQAKLAAIGASFALRKKRRAKTSANKTRILKVTRK